MRTAKFWLAMDEMELMSTTVLAAPRPWSKPFLPNSTASTWGASGTIRKTMSAACHFCASGAGGRPLFRQGRWDAPTRICVQIVAASPQVRSHGCTQDAESDESQFHVELPFESVNESATNCGRRGRADAAHQPPLLVVSGVGGVGAVPVMEPGLLCADQYPPM